MSRSSGRIPEGVHLGSVEFTADGIFELDRGVRGVFVAKPDISAGRVRRGFVAERATLGAVLGVAFLLLGVTLLGNLFDWARGVAASKFEMRLFFAGVTPACLGTFMVLHSVRRGVYLALETANGRRKLDVARTMSEGDIVEALQRARDEYGYVIEHTTRGRPYRMSEAEPAQQAAAPDDARRHVRHRVAADLDHHATLQRRHGGPRR